MYSVEELLAKYGDLYNEQLFIESRFKKEAEDKLRQSMEKERIEGQAGTQPIGQHFIRFVYDAIRQNVELFFEDKLKVKKGVKASYVGILQDLMDAYKDSESELYDLVAYSTISTMISMVAQERTVILSNISQALSVEIFDEYSLKRFFKIAKYPKQVLKGIDNRVQGFYRRAYLQATMKYEGYSPVKWNRMEAQAMAACFIEIVVDSTPYFTLAEGSKGMLVVEATNKLIEAWSKSEINMIEHAFKLCPTVIPPKPWTAYNDGGYYGDLQNSSNLLRLHDARTFFGQQYLKKLAQVELAKVRAAINAIQETPWHINIPVLKVMEQIVEQGGGKAGLPYFVEAPKPCVLSENPTQEELEHYKEVMPGWYKSETRRKSQALRALSHIKTAQMFAKYKQLYFPCNMDFRGRVYPIPTFNFQGDDLNKALILFADVPPCKDMEDIRWLAIHGANLAGVDKVSYDDRVQWVKDNEKDILASAEDPLGHLWWADQDEPCQMLAWCFEWKKWKDWEKDHDGNPDGFVSEIPIAMDGTCSGLQHFSAILRDPIGGYAVNLIPGDKPHDIYALVAAKVNERLQEDSKNGTPDETDDTGKVKYGTKTLAQIWLSYGVTRKVTKRPTMTLAYGAKEYGFRDQIMDDTIDPDIIEKEDASVFNKYNKWQSSVYMARLIWEAVGKTVVKAVEGMRWLQDCARIVTKKGNVVTWVTPLGLPVQQSYMKVETRTVQIRCAGKRIRLYGCEPTGNVDSKAQASGIAPNFIHSMDAAHLQLTVLNSVEAGIHHFAMIHDSYGCPVSQARTMYQVVRQSFVNIYTENDVLDNFRNDMQFLSTKKLPAIPSKDTLDIQEVLKSPYIFC